MKSKVKASFRNSDDAQLAVTRINAFSPSANCSIDEAMSDDGYYENAAVLPFTINNATVQSGFFVPVFPENITFGEERSSHSHRALVKVKCRNEDLGRVTSVLIECGGRIISD